MASQIEGFIARKADRAIIIYRKTSRVCQMLVWHFKNDKIEAGQWVKHSVLVSGFTEDGKYISIYGKTYRPRVSPNAWLAVSHPPYFTAIGLWETDTYFCFDTTGLPPNLKGLPIREDVLNMVSNPFQFLSREKLEKDKWKFEFADDKSARLYFERYRANINGTAIQYKNIAKGRIVIEYSGMDASGREIVKSQLRVGDDVIREWPRRVWIDRDTKGRLIFEDEGCLWAWADFPLGDPKLVADLNKNEFEEVAPPNWALKP